MQEAIKFQREETVALNHNETIMVLNNETAEVRELKQGKSKRPLPKGIHKHLPKERYEKYFKGVHEWLLNDEKDKLTPLQYVCLHKLILCSEFATNKIKPFTESTSNKEWMSFFGISKNMVSEVLKVFKTRGIIKEDEHKEKGVKYYLLNPYITYSGTTISDKLVDQFFDTEIAKYFNENIRKTKLN